MGYSQSNKNPAGLRVGDCTVRAIAEALGQSWEQTYIDLALQGLLMKDMPSANYVWGEYLRGKGFRSHLVPEGDYGPITVAEFSARHPMGTYILAISGHVVCVKDGDWLDSWDSGNEIPIYFWMKG